MKRIFTLSAILVVTGLLLPSCGTHLTIAKRQHSKGYYVDISTDKKSTQKQTETAEVRNVEENELATGNPKNGKPGKIGPVHVVKKVEETAEVASLAENQPATSEKAASKKLQVKAENSVAEADQSTTKGVKATVKDGVKKFTESKQMKKMESQRATDGLSLFWIIILILLILWALGWIGGLGGLIHLALVVALILLILWLLGIV